MAAYAPWATHRSARIAAGGLLVVAASFLPGAESVADGRQSETVIDYTCQFPSGSRAMTAVVAGTFPASGTVGIPVEPHDVTVGFDLSRGVLDELEEAGATKVSAVARLAVEYADRSGSAKADWSGLTAPAQDIAGRHSVTLTAGGPVPTATFGSAGTATLSAAGLTLNLSPVQEDGSAAAQAGIEVSCTPVEGAHGVLVSLPVTGPDTEEPVEQPPVDPELEDVIPPDQREELDDARREAAQPRAAAADSCPLPPIPFSIPAETYVTGYSNVKKLDAAVVLGPAHADVTLMKAWIIDSCLRQVRALSDVEFDYEGKRQLPPSEGTFLSFGFMPITATMVLSQVGPPGAIDSLSTNDIANFPHRPEYTTVSVQFDLRLKDVKVNGVPLDVGPNCRTAQPLHQTLHAFGTNEPPDGYTVSRGGTMDGNTYIPPFEGCGVGEDLDPLLTASISGGGNYIKMTQSPLCVSTNPTENCPPEKPKPER